jgi:hypothetical protein
MKGEIAPGRRAGGEETKITWDISGDRTLWDVMRQSLVALMFSPERSGRMIEVG